MDTAKKHDWGLVVAGVLSIICAFVILAAPGLTLVLMTSFAGAAFLVSGVFDAVGYFRARKAQGLSGWILAYAVLDVILGLMLLVHPLVFSGVLPWIVGVFFVAFGAFEVFAAFKGRKSGLPMWGWAIFSGLVGILCGITFFVYPATFSIFLAMFVLMRGVSLVVFGWSAGKIGSL